MLSGFGSGFSMLKIPYAICIYLWLVQQPAKSNFVYLILTLCPFDYRKVNDIFCFRLLQDMLFMYSIQAWIKLIRRMLKLIYFFTQANTLALRRRTRMPSPAISTFSSPTSKLAFKSGRQRGLKQFLNFWITYLWIDYILEKIFLPYHK
jgi:hypothetical protein